MGIMESATEIDKLHSIIKSLRIENAKLKDLLKKHDNKRRKYLQDAIPQPKAFK